MMEKVNHLKTSFRSKDNFLNGCFSVVLLSSVGIFIYFIYYLEKDKSLLKLLIAVSLAIFFFSFSVLAGRKTLEDRKNSDCIELFADSIYLGKTLALRRKILVKFQDIVDIHPFYKFGVQGIWIITKSKKFELNENKFFDINDFYYVADVLANGKKLNFKNRPYLTP